MKIENLKLKKLALRLSKGFTMIELLIVIAVLGILAVAVLSAINPIEQINRGKDTSSRSDAEQMVSAIERYYTSKGYYPWMLDAQSENWEVVDAEGGLAEIAAEGDLFGIDQQAVLTRLSSGGTQEVKSTYITRIVGDVNHLWLYHGTTSADSTYVCFVPASGSFREEAFVRCTAGGGLPADFPAAACPDTACNDEDDSSTAIGCYICLP